MNGWIVALVVAVVFLVAVPAALLIAALAGGAGRVSAAEEAEQRGYWHGFADGEVHGRLPTTPSEN